MKTYTGIWINHHKAIIVISTRPEYSFEKASAADVFEIKSNLERNVRLSGGSRTKGQPWGPQEITVDGRLEACLKQQRKKYYTQVFDRVKSSQKILVMGPGEAKHEL